jgi:hypothetical protein
MTALLAARQRCEIHRSGAEIEKNRIVKSQYAGPIRIADHMVRKERSHSKRDIRFGSASRAGRRRTNSTTGAQKNGTVRPAGLRADDCIRAFASTPYGRCSAAEPRGWLQDRSAVVLSLTIWGYPIGSMIFDCSDILRNHWGAASRQFTTMPPFGTRRAMNMFYVRI